MRSPKLQANVNEDADPSCYPASQPIIRGSSGDHGEEKYQQTQRRHVGNNLIHRPQCSSGPTSQRRTTEKAILSRSPLFKSLRSGGNGSELTGLSELPDAP